MNNIAYFEIQASQPEVLVAFYQQVFDWSFSKDDSLPIPYWRIKTAGMYGGLLERPTDTPPLGCGTNAFTCSIEVADIDATAEVIVELGGQVALDKFEVPGVCWQAYYLDPDGNTFGLFQPQPHA
ncbi:VOC family protein [Gilvimarinus sp. DA14]|uniref:VOC family protein n=1 Tax=Gilvimarinus sp. DA14 TaxID=2956798 RepID=UPI0020B74F3E|nr:VOC family protein [Gilvimarinus sp. DA14]UTF61566.1 VOC family protein [Gilvimarinus sp. DA14]